MPFNIELSNTVILRRALLISKRALKTIVHSDDLSEKHAKKTGLLNDKFMCLIQYHINFTGIRRNDQIELAVIFSNLLPFEIRILDVIHFIEREECESIPS